MDISRIAERIHRQEMVNGVMAAFSAFLDAAQVCLSVPSPVVCRSSNERFMHTAWTR